jgi:nitrile hydratase accessory protein
MAEPRSPQPAPTETASPTGDLSALLRGLPGDAGGAVFREPWEAQAFALAVVLERRGLFTWSEWAEMLGAEIRAAEAATWPSAGADYYRHWLATLERMVAHRGVAGADALARCRNALARAARRTPHGSAIELRAEDF